MSEPHRWTHTQCNNCWYRVWSDTRTPVRVTDVDPGQCCFCGTETASGIFVRVTPEDPSIPYCPDVMGVIYTAVTSHPHTPHQPTDAPGSDARSSPPSA